MLIPVRRFKVEQALVPPRPRMPPGEKFDFELAIGNRTRLLVQSLDRGLMRHCALIGMRHEPHRWPASVPEDEGSVLCREEA